jgi:ABC-type lipoprotein release transport system permease subunit
VETVTEAIANLVQGREISVSPWQVFADEFHNGMQADEASLRIVLGIIIGMAALGVLNTILMMVLERRREFGVMKAIGTRPGSIVKMLLIEACIMGCLSVLLGSLFATGGLLFLSSHGWVLDPPLDFGGFAFREMQAAIKPECYWIPAVIVMVTASLVSLLPALKAARTDPARSLRMN